MKNVEPKSEFLPPKDQELDTDLAYIRSNQYQLIEKGIQGLDGIYGVAEQSQHPRAYEVLSTYLRTLSELNKDLMITAEKRKEAKDPAPQKLEGAQTTNNLFVGSTKDLQEMLKIAQRKNEDGAA